MARPRHEVMRLRFAEEIDRRAQGGRVERTDPMAVGELLGMDPLEVANAVTWLASRRLVAVHGVPEALVEPYTNEELALTEDGKRFARGGD